MAGTTLDGAPVTVILTMDDDAFIETEAGDKVWVPRAQLQTEDSPAEAIPAEDWKVATERFLSSLQLQPVEPLLFRPLRDVCSAAVDTYRPGDAVCLRGLLNPEAVQMIHKTAKDAFTTGWGTVRRRSVGHSESAITPYQTHVRLTRHFQTMADVAWNRVSEAVEAVDKQLWGRFSAGQVASAMKQADYLIYDGARSDWVGWHDHAGESKLFIVLMLSDPENFAGGAFSFRNLESGEEVEMALQLGDAVLCPSEMEHAVCPVVAGQRVSINLDFWDVDNKSKFDYRSEQDKY